MDHSGAGSPAFDQSLNLPPRRITESPMQMDGRTPEPTELEAEKDLSRKAQAYELPEAVKASLGSWTKGANSLAIIMVLFASVQMTLIQLVIQQDQGARSGGTTDDLNSDPTQSLPWRVMRWFMYAGVLVDLGGTASAIAIVNMSSAAPINARNKALSNRDSLPRKVLDGKPIPENMLLESQETVLLRDFGISKWFNRVGWHMLVSFMLGSLFILISLSIWIWVTEPIAVSATLMPVVLLSVLPVAFVAFGDGS